MNHIMIDIESLSTTVDAVVLTIGATKFNIENDSGIIDSFYVRVDIGEQILLGRQIDANTIDWWNDQTENARNDAFKISDRMSVSDALDGLSKFIDNSVNIWAQGVTFDIVVLASLYENSNKKVPWKYNSVRDSRTVLALFGDSRSRVSHNALEDAIEQTIALKAALKGKL